MTAKTIAGVVVLLVIGKPALAGAVMQTFIAVKDAKMRSDDGGQCANAMGSVVPLLVGVNCAKLPCFTGRTLLHFDLSAIPHGSTVSGATLQLWVSGMINSGTAAHISVMRSRQPLWDEGALIWETYDCPENSWCNVGGDFDDQANVVPWSLSTTGIKTINHANLAALVNDAVQRRGGQLPLFFKQTVESTDPWVMVQFSSREDTDPDFRPQLTLTWTAPAPTPGPTPAWVTFRDETAERLSAPPTGPEGQACSPAGPSGWMACDRLEKDVTVGDFDDDGDEDVVIVRKQPFNMRGPAKDIFLRNEDGKLIDRTQHTGNSVGPFFFAPVASDARDVFAGDLDGDGFQDLVIATTCNDPGGPKFYENLGSSMARCAVWPGFQDKTADWRPQPYEADGQRFCAVGGGFINDDGQMDLYLSNYRRPCPNDLDTTVSAKDHLLINGNIAAGGRFLDETTARLGGNATNGGFGTSVELVSLDGAGGDDIARVRATTLEALLNAGDPANFVGDVTGLGTAYMMTTGDLTGDGKPDVYQARDGTDQWFENTGANPPFESGDAVEVGTMTFGEPTDKLGGNTKMADVDGDGDLDVGVADVDAEFPNSCNVCQVGINTCSETGATGASCTFPNHAGCAEDNVTVANDPAFPRTRFSLVRNSTAAGATALQNPWGIDDSSQAFNLKSYDFAFVDMNGDGCQDLFLGLCSGYRVLIQSCPSTGAFN